MFQAGDVVETDFEGFLKLLRSKTRAFVSINDHEYYITHTDGYWRVQDCEALNDKGHFTDCSELVNTVCEVVELPWICGKSLHDSFSGATCGTSSPWSRTVSAEGRYSLMATCWPSLSTAR